MFCTSVQSFEKASRKFLEEKTVTRKLMWPVHHIIPTLQRFIHPTAPKTHPHAFIINVMYAYGDLYLQVYVYVQKKPNQSSNNASCSTVQWQSSRSENSPQNRSPVSCSAHSDKCPDGKAGDGTAAQEQQWKTLHWPDEQPVWLSPSHDGTEVTVQL